MRRLNVAITILGEHKLVIVNSRTELYFLSQNLFLLYSFKFFFAEKYQQMDVGNPALQKYSFIYI